jgi:IS30 family transposase
MDTFFCDPYAPWQKGGIENAIGRMRRFMPRKTDLTTLSNAQFQAAIAAYNNTPRKCLDWKTPAETFSRVLHFECESTPRLRGDDITPPPSLSSPDRRPLAPPP